MSTTTITIIALSVLLGISSTLFVIAILRNGCLHKRISRLRETIKSASLSDNDQKPRYVCGSYHGSQYAVWRRSILSDTNRDTLIKLFVDDDPSFNRLCAEELCDTLNTK